MFVNSLSMSPIVPSIAHVIPPTLRGDFGDHGHHRFRAGQGPRHALSSKRLNITDRVTDQENTMIGYPRGTASQAGCGQPLILFRQFDFPNPTLGQDSLYDLPNAATRRNTRRINGCGDIQQSPVCFANANIPLMANQHVQTPIGKYYRL